MKQLSFKHLKRYFSIGVTNPVYIPLTQILSISVITEYQLFFSN